MLNMTMQQTFPEFLAEIVKTSYDIWLKGWAEANGGNISVRLKAETVQEIPDLSPKSAWIDLDGDLPELAREYFLVTGTGRYLRNIQVFPEKNVGVIEINDTGKQYRIVWGYQPEGKPTSELLAHLKTHAVRKRVSQGVERAVIHTHATNLIALTYVLHLDTARLSKLLWQMHSECIVAFPEGAHFLPWKLAGSSELAEATAQALTAQRIAVWQFHGAVGVGRNLDAAFGIIDVADKAAGIYLMAMAAGGIKHKLTAHQLAAIAAMFQVQPDMTILQTEV